MLDAMEEMMMMKKKKKKGNLAKNTTTCARTVHTKFDLDCALASMGSFGMNTNRTVYKLQNGNFRGGRGRGRDGRMGGRGRSSRGNGGRGRAGGDARNHGNPRNYNN